MGRKKLWTSKLTGNNLRKPKLFETTSYNFEQSSVYIIFFMFKETKNIMFDKIFDRSEDQN